MLGHVHAYLSLFLAPDQCDRVLILIREHLMHYRDYDAELLTPDQVQQAIQGLQDASAALLGMGPSGVAPGAGGALGKVLQAHQRALAVLQTSLIALQLQARQAAAATPPADNGPESDRMAMARGY